MSEFEKLQAIDAMTITDIDKESDSMSAFYGKQDKWIVKRILELEKIEENIISHLVKITTKEQRRRWKEEDFIAFRDKLTEDTHKELEACRYEQYRRTNIVIQKTNRAAEVKRKLNRDYRLRIQAGVHTPISRIDRKAMLTEDDLLDDTEKETKEIEKYAEIAAKNAAKIQADLEEAERISNEWTPDMPIVKD